MGTIFTHKKHINFMLATCSQLFLNCNVPLTFTNCLHGDMFFLCVSKSLDMNDFFKHMKVQKDTKKHKI